MLIREATAITGGLGKPSKMPGAAYGLPAAECNVGSKLRKVKGSVCATCYALKGRYAFENVLSAEYRRLESLNDLPLWIDAMTVLIKNRVKWFRWHDAGDIQSLEHLEAIVEIALRCSQGPTTPETHFWLPTKENGIVKRYLAKGKPFPSNLVVRVSGAMIDGAPPTFDHTSTVHKNSAAHGFVCPAPAQGGNCGDCRACWDSDNANTSYHVH